MTNEMPNVKETNRYSVAEAAEILGVHRTTLYNKIKAGAHCGGIASGRRRSGGGMYITGKEILRYWRG